LVVGLTVAACSNWLGSFIANKAVGPLAQIPRGTLIAGTACGTYPSVPGEELGAESIDMGAFDIDAYPYPNDPQAPPTTGVSRKDAQELCEARGRRLCTDLEWERACKGPSNTRYAYGDDFDPKACPVYAAAMPAYGDFKKCTSAFGVHAMHGFAWEWTGSNWKRGKEAGKGVLHGGVGGTAYATMRCSAVRASDPGDKGKDIGFRCCGGTTNTKEVVIPAEVPDPAPIASVASVDETLLERLRHALGDGSYKDPAGTTGKLTNVWRWHPAPKEELFVARYESVGQDGLSREQPFVFRLCDKSEQFLGRPLYAPVKTIGEPVARQTSPALVTFHIDAWGQKGEVKLSYLFGEVVVDSPPWLKVGFRPPAGAASSVRDASTTGVGR
jgi:hypothetical protein